MSNFSDVIIVGAGASGLVAGISAARQNADVILLEHMDRPGKKILSTGNGKCNFTNQEQGVSCYHGNDPAFVLPVFEQFGFSETLSFFQELGILPRQKREGYYYPASEQASSILDVLLMEAKRLHIRIECGVGIRSIKKEKKCFVFDTKQGTYKSKSCIIATGGKSYKHTGSDGSGIPYILSFSHHISELFPALVPLKAKESYFKQLSGIRVMGGVSAFIEGRKVCEDYGEIQFTDYGISGIPVFQISRYISKALLQKKAAFVQINFMNDITKENLIDYLNDRFHKYGGNKNMEQALIGLFHSKLIPVLLGSSKIKPSLPAVQCSMDKILRLADTIRNFKAEIYDTRSFDFAQVTAGGVVTKEIISTTMESKITRGLYFAGEVIDIDGICGGYNLQWAFSSGFIAGKNAGAYGHGGNV